MANVVSNVSVLQQNIVGKKENAGEYNVEAIRLVNFKAFNDSGWIVLKPIVLLMGNNSTGKSSISQAFRMLSLAYNRLQDGNSIKDMSEISGEFGEIADIRFKNSNEDACIKFRMSNGKNIIVYSVWIGEMLYSKIEGEETTEFSDSQISIFFLHSDAMYKNALVDIVNSAMKDFADKIKLVKPHRDIPDRFIRATGNNNGNTYNVLFYLSEIKNELPAPVKEWLKKLGYELIWQSVGKNTGQFMLRNITSGIETNIVDNGFGISQSLAVSLEVSLNKEGILVIDSPEAHLQPPMQSEMADVLISGMTGQNVIMAETGSEYLFLRLCRRIKEGVIFNSDISVYYIEVDAQSGAAMTNEVFITEQGKTLGKKESFKEFFSSGFVDTLHIEGMNI